MKADIYWKQGGQTTIHGLLSYLLWRIEDLRMAYGAGNIKKIVIGGQVMDVGSKHGYPAGALSNFSPHPFTIDGVECASMEGFLQSLKFKNPEMQKHVCTLVGFKAKAKGKHKNWQESQTLYWQGQAIKRESDEYQVLLDKAFRAMKDCSDSFRRALKASQGANLTHSIGKSDPKQTVLTEREFCSRLTKLREELI